MGIGIAILPVNVANGPDRVSYGTSSILKQWLLSFKVRDIPLKKKDKKRFLNQRENLDFFKGLTWRHFYDTMLIIFMEKH